MLNRRPVVTCCGLLLVGLASWGRAATEDEAFLARVKAAWEAREQRVQSFIVEWVEQRTIPKGKDGLDEKNRPLPPRDTTRPVTYRMVCVGRQVRLARQGVQYDVAHREYLDKHFVRVFDGKERRELFDNQRSNENPGGFVNQAGVFDDGTYLQIQPPLLHFRPLASSLCGIRMDDWHLIGRSGMVGDRRCRILDRDRAERIKEELWIEDSGEYDILKRQSLFQGVAFEELTIRAQLSAENVMAPSKWTYITRNESSKVTEADVVADVEVQINPSVPVTEFQYVFPAGTVVTYEGETRRAIARSDGSLRPITNGEIAAGIPYEALMSTDPPLEVNGAERGWISLALSIAIGLACGGAWLGWRRFQRR